MVVVQASGVVISVAVGGEGEGWPDVILFWGVMGGAQQVQGRSGWQE